MESLSQYVKRVMQEKHLTAKEVERRSDGQIGDSHIINVANGTTTNLTVDKMKALAIGLGVDPIELFRVAIDIDVDEVTLPLVARVFEKLSSPSFSRLLIHLDRMNQQQLKTLLFSLEKGRKK